jgi:ribosome-binding factor A
MDRMTRVNELLKRELGEIFERRICGDFDCLVTVTAVKTSPDLHNAHVYVSVFGTENQRKVVLTTLLKKRKDIQREMSRHVILKCTPVLEFQLDTTLDDADRIHKILEDLNIDADRDLQP